MQNLIASLPPVNYPAMFVAAFAMILVGTVWYSHRLFGKAWVRHTGIRPTDIRPAESRRNYIVTIFVALLSAYLLGVLASHVGHSLHIFCGVAFIWLFVMLEQMNGFLWRRDPFALFLLQTFRSLFSLLAAGAVFYFWS